jgi:aspartate 1-decarboxylase
MLDSWISYYVSSNKKRFATYNPDDFGVVCQVNGAPQRIMYMGDIKMVMN